MEKKRTGPQQKVRVKRKIKKVKARKIVLKNKRKDLQKELKKLRAERAKDIELFGKPRARPIARRQKRIPTWMKGGPLPKPKGKPPVKPKVEPVKVIETKTGLEKMLTEAVGPELEELRKKKEEGK